MDDSVREIYRLILKHKWTVAQFEARPIFNHARLNMRYEIELISPNKMVDRDITLYGMQAETQESL